MPSAAESHRVPPTTGKSPITPFGVGRVGLRHFQTKGVTK